tara:strand:+ start:4775 stop:5674 length:900 start_codon:yes stop_codon:yes gene_type:complete
MLCGARTEGGIPEFNVRVYDDLRFGQTPLLACATFDHFQFFKCDAGDDRHLKSLAQWADVVVPLAAIVGAPACQANRDEAWRVNVTSIRTLVSLLEDHPNVHVIYPNTNSGYGTSGDMFCTEDTPLEPISHYGMTKGDSEKCVLRRDTSTVFRLATVFGVSPRMRWDLMVNDFVRRAYREQHICIFDGHVRRNFVAVVDVARAFLWAIHNPKESQGVFNLGNDSLNMTKLELAQNIKQHFPACSVVEGEFGADPDQRDYIVSSDKLRAAGFVAKTALEDCYDHLLKALKMWPREVGQNV